VDLAGDTFGCAGRVVGSGGCGGRRSSGRWSQHTFLARAFHRGFHLRACARGILANRPEDQDQKTADDHEETSIHEIERIWLFHRQASEDGADAIW